MSQAVLDASPRERARVRILFVTPRFPHPPRKGDQLRVYHALRSLGGRHEIDLVSAADAPVEETSLAEMRRWCRSVYVVPVTRANAVGRIAARIATTRLPLQVLYFDSRLLRDAVAGRLAAERYDVVHAQLLRVLPHLWELASPPVVVDLMDAFGLSLAGRRDRAHPLARPLYEFERRRIAAYERRALERFPELVVAADGDRTALGGDGRLSAVTNGVDLDAFAFGEPGGRDPQTAIMTGNMGYGPNVDAALWFANDVWPLVRARRPQARLRFVGAAPTSGVRALARDDVEVTGAVANVNAELRRATLAVCPMRTGTGVQNKVLEALASGTPVVSTTLGNRGVGAEPGRDLVIADDARTTAQSILALFDDPAGCARLGAAGRRLMEDAYGWDTHARKLEAIYARAIARSTEALSPPPSAGQS